MTIVFEIKHSHAMTEQPKVLLIILEDKASSIEKLF